MCAVNRINSMVYKEKKVTILLAGCRHLCDVVLKVRQQTLEKNKTEKKNKKASTNFGGSCYCTKFLRHMALSHLYGQKE